MRRRLATSVWVVVLLAWAASVAVWVRGWFRADLLGVVLPGHVYVEVQTHAGNEWLGDAKQTSLAFVRHWPAPTSVHLSSAPARFDPWGDNPRPDELVGPEEWGSWLNERPREWSWRGFACTRTRLWFRAGPDGRPLLDLPRRDWKFWSGPPPETTDGLPSVSVTLPNWLVPVAASMPPLLWVATAGRSRFRVFRRRRRGLCVRCGYDRRHAQGRCPECGAG